LIANSFADDALKQLFWDEFAKQILMSVAETHIFLLLKPPLGLLTGVKLHCNVPLLNTPKYHILVGGLEHFSIYWE